MGIRIVTLWNCDHKNIIDVMTYEIINPIMFQTGLRYVLISL